MNDEKATLAFTTIVIEIKKKKNCLPYIQIIVIILLYYLYHSFTNPGDETSTKTSLTKTKSSAKTPSIKKTVSAAKVLKPRPPLKKSETIRRLVQQKSIRTNLVDAVKTSNSVLKDVSPKQQWRKPPKKQSTIRILARKASAARVGRIVSVPKAHNTQQTPIKKAVSSVKKVTISQRPPKRQLFDTKQGQNSPVPTKVQAKSVNESLPVLYKTVDEQPMTLGTVTFLQRSATLTAVEIKKSFLNFENAGNVSLSRKQSLSKQDTLQICSTQSPLSSSSSKSSLSTMPSLTLGKDSVYIPPKREWPLQMVRGLSII